MKILAILGFLVAAAYLVFWELPVLKWGYDISKSQQQISAGEAGDLIELMEGPAPVRWWKDRTKLNDTFNTSFLSDARQVHVEVALPFEELLNEGEAMPEEVFRDVYVFARTPAYLINLCDELLNTIAVVCDLSRPEGEMARDGLAEMQGGLRFVPADDPGELPQTDEAEYMNLSFTLTGEEDVPYTAAARENAMKVSALLCKALRAQVGNCVITRLYLEPQRRARAEGQMLMQARTVLTVYADPAHVDEDALKETLTQVRRIVGI